MATYKELQSITIKGTNTYFDTGIKCADDLSFEAKVTPKYSNWSTIIGNYGDNGSDVYMFRVRGTEGTLSFELGVETTNTIPYTSSTTYNVKFGNYYIKNLGTGAQKSLTTKSFGEKSYNILIGNDRPESTNNTDCDYYYVKIYRGEDLVADYIPVLDSTDRVALYDKVSGNFIYHTGSGSVTYTEIPPKLELKVPKSASVNLYPKHTNTPEKYVRIGSSQSLKFNDIKIYQNGWCRWQIKFRTTATTPNCHIGCGSTAYRFFQYQSSYGYYDVSNGRLTPKTSINTIYNFEFGNYYIKDLNSGSYVVQSSTKTNADKTGYLQFAAGIDVAYAKAYDGEGTLILDCVPMQNEDGVWVLHDRVGNIDYGADLNMSVVELSEVTSKWKKAKSVDLGGYNVTLQGNLTDWKSNTTIESFNNGNIANTDYTQLFMQSESLTEVSNLHLDNITNGTQLFENCAKLKSASIGNTKKLASNLNMFYGCTALSSVSMSLSSVTNWNNMFYNCTALKEWHIKDLGIECSTLLKPNVTTIGYIADNAKSVSNNEWFVMTDAQYQANSTAVSTLQGKGWNVYNASNYPKDQPTSKNRILLNNTSVKIGAQTYSSQLEGVDRWFSVADSASTLTNLTNLCSDNKGVKKVYIDFGSVTEGSRAFKYCTNLTEFSGDLSSLKYNGYRYPESGMFSNCSALTSFTTTSLDNLLSGEAMFRNCLSLKEFKYDMPNLIDGEWMFHDCKSLEIFESDLHSLQRGGRMFLNNFKLKTFKSNLSSLTNQYDCYCGVNGSMFSACTSLTNFMVSQLPICSSLTLNIGQSPVNYDSFVYMGENTENAPIRQIEKGGEWVVSTYNKPTDCPEGYNMYMSNKNYKKDGQNAIINLTFTADGTYNIYINSYGESGYDFTRASQLDSTTDIATTKGFSKDPSGSIETNYKLVTYTISDGKTHTAQIYYGKDGSNSSNYDRGFILVPENVLTDLESTIVDFKSGCTLNLSTASKDLSASTDVVKYWNLLDAKGYRISGYTADHENLPEGWYIDEDGNAQKARATDSRGITISEDGTQSNNYEYKEYNIDANANVSSVVFYRDAKAGLLPSTFIDTKDNTTIHNNTNNQVDVTFVVYNGSGDVLTEESITIEPNKTTDVIWNYIAKDNNITIETTSSDIVSHEHTEDPICPDGYVSPTIGSWNCSVLVKESPSSTVVNNHIFIPINCDYWSVILNVGNDEVYYSGLITILNYSNRDITIVEGGWGSSSIVISKKTKTTISVYLLSQFGGTQFDTYSVEPLDD